ncbi:MAG: pyruvate dehydrogenase complex dihydrolipoamide acetyltransferase [Candidatus Symbiobacter sp.]|nr:pyruvate dehydrogenase complex dihydrolipoamide acetyltransferase [Candidatus Symbiobacter sp.]
MPIEILMPALSPTMTEGNIAKWLKREGDKVKSGDVMLEIETDKATMEVESVDDGVIGKILYGDGSKNVKVNQRIGVILKSGETAADIDKFSPPKTATAPTPTNAPTPAKAATAIAAATTPATSGGGGSASIGGGTASRIMVSPLAKRMATEAGIDLAKVTGTGPHGRIVKSDIESFPSGGGKGASPAKAAPQPGILDAFELIPHSSMRKTIAKRLTESKRDIPHFYLSQDLDIGALMSARARLNANAPIANEKGGDKAPAYKLSVNDFIIKAVAMALAKMPDVNAAWSDDGMMKFQSVDVAVAVALPNNGLITPIVRAADQKSLSVISNEIKELAKRARDGKLKPHEYQGGGFSVSNLGMYGIDQFTPIINPPQSCIMGVGAGLEKPVVRGGKIEVATVMNVTLACDHRVVDGALGADFMKLFKAFIEEPVMMLV